MAEPPILGFLGSSLVKNLPADAGEVDSIPELRKSPGGGNGNPLQYSYLGNSMDRGAWWATVHWVVKRSDTTEQLKQQQQPLITMAESLHSSI